MPPLPRASVDYVAIELFTRWALDVEGTGRKVAEATDARLAQVSAQAARAERDERKAAERLARVRRDYTDGKIDAEDWRSFRDELESEHAAAQAKVRQLATQAERVRKAAALLTAEDDVLLRIHDLHVAVTSRMRAAATASEAEADVGPLRAALGQVFESIVVRWPTPEDFDDATVFEVPAQRGLFLEPRLRPEV
jgi:hypothetical protein